MSDLLDNIKVAALEAVRQSKPVEVIFGTVMSVYPLKVRVSSRLILDSAHLVRTWSMEHIGTGDRVALLRAQGGQKYLIIDKVVG